MVMRLKCVIGACFLVVLLTTCQTTGKDIDRQIKNQTPLNVSQETYDKTFTEILQFIKKMDTIIATKDFERWKSSCSQAYVSHFSDQTQLKEISQKPYLRENHIVLASLEDYFLNVFIPSRTEAKLDKIDFIDEHRVKAVTVVDGVPYIVYLLEKDANNQWKIGLW
jgi:hypothetical protein